MNWYIKQFYRGLANCRKCLLIPFVPLALYLALASLWADRYDIRLALAMSPDVPIADSSDPAAARPLRELISRPAILFEDDFALMQLYKYLYKSVSDESAEDSLATMKAYVGRTMSLREAAGGRIEFAYFGNDREAGESLVGFFADQLLKKAREGQVRSGKTVSALPPRLGPPQARAERALWRPERLVPALAIFGLSLLLVLAFILAYEWADPSFKSERQVARYMDLPVFGSIPNLAPLAGALRETERS